jgi:hypothetical protein
MIKFDTYALVETGLDALNEELFFTTTHPIRLMVMEGCGLNSFYMFDTCESLTDAITETIYVSGIDYD